MAAEDVARELRLRAIANGLIARDQLAPDAATPPPNAQIAGVPAIVADTPDVIRRVGVNFIGFNNAGNEVAIYTNKLVRKKLQAALPVATAQGLTDFLSSRHARIDRKAATKPIGTPPDTPHNALYLQAFNTCRQSARGWNDGKKAA